VRRKEPTRNSFLPAITPPPSGPKSYCASRKAHSRLTDVGFGGRRVTGEKPSEHEK
jgi:hypothetical protein